MEQVEMAISDFGGDNAGKISVSEKLFARAFVDALVSQAVRASLAGGRQGTRAQKNRTAVRHTRRKMFRQKGTGRARGGHASTPLRRGGGRAFPSSPDENFVLKMNRRMFRAAMAVILSRLVAEERFLVVRQLAAERPKTAEAVAKLTAMNVSGKVLLVDEEWDENFLLSCRNVPGVSLVAHSNLLATDLVDADHIIFSERAVRRSEAVWQ